MEKPKKPSNRAKIESFNTNLKMKTFITVLSLILGLSFATAQDEIETLINGSIDITGFQFGSSLKVTTAKGIPLAFIGAEGSMMLNHQFKVGVAGYHNLRLGEFLSDMEGDFNMFYAGGLFGYIFNANKAIHLSTDLFIGGGQVYSLGQNSVGIAGFLVLEPQVDLELNITKFSKIAIGGGIRGIRSIYDETIRIADGNLTAPYVSIGIKIGKF